VDFEGHMCTLNENENDPEEKSDEAVESYHFLTKLVIRDFQSIDSMNVRFSGMNGKRNHEPEIYTSSSEPGINKRWEIKYVFRNRRMKGSRSCKGETDS
jgi:hypothetical protein